MNKPIQLDRNSKKFLLVAFLQHKAGMLSTFLATQAIPTEGAFYKQLLRSVEALDTWLDTLSRNRSFLHVSFDEMGCTTLTRAARGWGMLPDAIDSLFEDVQDLQKETGGKQSCVILKTVS